MAEPAEHSPAPFRLDETQSGFLLFDAFGDSIGALALETGDHPYEEQRANARLFKASPLLLGLALKAARFIDGFEGHPELDSDGSVTALLHGLRKAIIQAEGGE